MKAVYPPAQVAPYDSSSSGASPPATHWTKLATKAIAGPAVTHDECRAYVHRREGEIGEEVWESKGLS
jgi:hypothetical protein